MRIQKLECPYCSGPLDIVRDHVVHYCPHCGKPLAISDENTVTINKNVYVKNESHDEKINRIIDVAKITKEQRKIEEAKSDRLRLIVAFLAVIILIIFEYAIFANL